MEDKMCAVVKDLLSLYCDDALRDESRQVIEEHLSSCASCLQYKADIDSSKTIKSSGEKEGDEILNMKKVATRLRRRRRRIVITVVAMFLMLIVLLTQVFNFSEIVGESMEPTFSQGQNLAINRWAYKFSSPKRGDIVYINQNDYRNIKRIIGLPGEYVDIKNGELLINRTPLEEDYISSNMLSTGDVTYPVVLGDGEYFVLGDNTNSSMDSRYDEYGELTRDEIFGKVIFKTINIFTRSEVSQAK